MEKDDKGSTVIRMGVSGWMFLLVPAYPGCPISKAVKRSLLYYMSVLWWNVSRTLLIWCTMISHRLVVSQCITATQRVSWQPKLLPFCVAKLLLFWKPSLVVVYSKSALDWCDRNLLEWPGITNVQERHCVCFVYFVTCSFCASSQTWWLRNAVLVKLFINFLFVLISKYLQCFNAVGWASGRAFSL